MKIAVVSDLHANLDALEAVLGRVVGMDVYCLGDLVDYGAEPNAVIDLVRRRGVRCIAGNHDVAAVDGDTSMFNARAAMSSIWTRRSLDQDSASFLKGLPLELRLSLEGTEVYLTHGSPDDRLWEYVDPRTHEDLFGHYLDRTGSSLIGLGHTHVPYLWKEGVRAVFNPGSVGQPRDGDRRASYAVVTAGPAGFEVELKRVEYDFESAAAKIREAGLPGSFADRLYTGS